MKFVDYVTITVRSGSGGPGSTHFRHAKYEPLGGPDGGDGGAGASVLLEGDPQLYTLLDLRYNRHHYAENGLRGDGAQKTGRSGTDIVLRVPIGTVVRDSDSGAVLGEVLETGQQLVLVQGGRGGKGNAFFKSSTNRAPRHHQPGEEGEERNVTLELKLLADVGLVGFPNAGKSTLVATISAARPKIADYPFTTLKPSLGVVGVGDYESFVIADIPGIIEGAHEGRGLGVRFLRHIERNAVLLFVVPIDTPDPAEAFRVLVRELEAFSPDLARKPRLIGLSKLDLLPASDRDEWVRALTADLPEGETVVPFSAVAHIGLDRLRGRLWLAVKEARQEA